jgi:Flp pilus assembly protein TadG
MKTKHRGIGLVWTVAFLLALIAIGGLVIDASRVYITGHQLQNAADASALAGARYVAWDPNSATKIAARLEALEYSQANKAANLAVNLDLNTPNAPAGDIVIGIYNPNQPNPLLRFTPMSTSDMLNRSPNAMKIVTRKDDAQNPSFPSFSAVCSASVPQTSRSTLSP